jgi:hypothetical protein
MQDYDDEKLVGTKFVCDHFGGKNTRTMDRWIANPDLDFPQPMMINGRRFWTLRQIREFERRQARSGAAS